MKKISLTLPDKTEEQLKELDEILTFTKNQRTKLILFCIWHTWNVFKERSDQEILKTPTRTFIEYLTK